MLAKTTVILRLGLMLLVGLSDVAVGGTLPRDVDSTGRVLTLCQLAFPRASDPKQQGRRSDTCYALALEVALHYFHTIQFGYISQPSLLRERTTQRQECQEAGMIGASPRRVSTTNA